jgi:hypothetical protein
VIYIVQAVQAVQVLLRTGFGREDGLADPTVVLLDPASGPAPSCSARQPKRSAWSNRKAPRRGELVDGKVVDVHDAGLSSFQWPSETTSTSPSVTLMAV